MLQFYHKEKGQIVGCFLIKFGSRNYITTAHRIVVFFIFVCYEYNKLIFVKLVIMKAIFLQFLCKSINIKLINFS